MCLEYSLPVSAATITKICSSYTDNLVSLHTVKCMVIKSMNKYERPWVIGVY